MVNKTTLERIYGHCAVRLDNFIIICGGSYGPWSIATVSTCVIWTYNLYTDKWTKHATTKRREGPEPFEQAVAVAIGGTVYIFGGWRYGSYESNELWTLNRTETGSFTWSFIKYHSDKESPSPRHRHTGWQYAGKLWIFGGKGPSPEQFLRDHGDIAGGNVTRNNQLLSYNPDSNRWTNPQSFGEVPSPRSDHSSTIIRDKVFLLGGYNESFSWHDDLFQLDMYTLTWTRIQTDQDRPGTYSGCTLTAITDNQLVLRMLENDTWIMDLTSHSWRRYTSGKDNDRENHTATLGLNSNIIIIGGYFEEQLNKRYKKHDNICAHVMLEPKCLQKLAAHTIYKHQTNLSWKCLPKKLIALLGISGKSQSSASSFSSSACTDHWTST